MKICAWCVREIPWWRFEYCRPCAAAFRWNKPGPPARPTYAAEWISDSRRRRNPKVTWL